MMADGERFTVLGGRGMIGQHLLSHVVCDNCHTSFNSKTGGSNTMNIVIYHVVFFVLAMGLVGVLAIAGALE